MISLVSLLAFVWVLVGLSLGIRHLMHSEEFESGNFSSAQLAGYLLLTAVFGFPVLALALLTAGFIYVAAVVSTTITTIRRK